MKTTKLIKLTIMAMLLPFSIIASAADGIGYFPTKKGTKSELTTYDKKNKVINVSTSEVTESNPTACVVHIISKDANGKVIFDTNYDVNFTPDGIVADQKKLIVGQISSKITDPSVKTNISGNNSIIPYTLNIGQSLPQNEIVLKIITSAMTMNMTFKTFNRQVVAQEKIKVPAGTFECMVITSNIENKLMVTKKNTVKTWVAKGVGIVKQETYSTNGKLEKTELLTTFSS